MLVHAICLVLFLLTYAFYNYTRLPSIPGPVLAGVSRIWRIYVQNSPNYSRQLGDLQQRYGKVVRIGPNVVSVLDPVAITQMYGNDMNGKFIQNGYMNTGREQQTIASVHVSNRLQGRLAETGYQSTEFQEYEGIIDQSARDLVSALRRHRVLELAPILEIFASEFVHRSVAGSILKREAIRTAPPSATEYLLFCSPIMRLKRGRQDRFSCVSTRQISWKPSPYCGLDFLSRDGMFNGEYLAVIAAGMDTLTMAFVSTFALLVRHPGAMSRVNGEIDTALYNGNMSDVPQWAELNRLRYLDAVFKESIRLGSSTRSTIEKAVPSGGTTVFGYRIPAGTIVEWQLDAPQCDRDIYGENVEIFRPERWLTADPQKRKRMEQGLLAFNISRRMCVAFRAAWLELKKVLVLILLQFNIQLLEENEDSPGDVKYPPAMVVNLVQRMH